MLRDLGGTCPPIFQVIGRQMLVTDMDPAVTQEQVFSPNSGVPGKCYLRQSPTYKRALMEVQISREVPEHHWNKNMNLEALECASSKDWRSDCYFKCEDNNAKFQGT